MFGQKVNVYSFITLWKKKFEMTVFLMPLLCILKIVCMFNFCSKVNFERYSNNNSILEMKWHHCWNVLSVWWVELKENVFLHSCLSLAKRNCKWSCITGNFSLKHSFLQCIKCARKSRRHKIRFVKMTSSSFQLNPKWKMS